MIEDSGDGRTYVVVINHEEQYSIWWADREPPLGWRMADKRGRKEECLAYISEAWTDMRPLSLRRHMDSVVDSEHS
jgi:MbtH protein